jgi:Ca-activated chloride channel family protein
LAALPLLVLWYRRQYRQGQVSYTISTTWVLKKEAGAAFWIHTPFILRLLGMAALILALARPQVHHRQDQQEGEGIDIMLCMDVSGSMGSRDIQPSRLEAAKAVAIEFVEQRPVDRIGLVIFSGESFTQCPLTSDRATLITQLQNLESRRYLTDGTVIGEGLATAVDRLSAGKARSKVVILLTDGKEDPPETRLIDPLSALEIARAKGVKVYTIGMSALPVSPAAPGSGPSAAVDYLDETLLRNMAVQTGGLYFRAANREALKQVYQQIDQLEKSKVEIQSFTRTEEKFQLFIWIALGCLLLEWLLRFTLLRKFP